MYSLPALDPSSSCGYHWRIVHFALLFFSTTKSVTEMRHYTIAKKRMSFIVNTESVSWLIASRFVNKLPSRTSTIWCISNLEPSPILTISRKSFKKTLLSVWVIWGLQHSRLIQPSTCVHVCVRACMRMCMCVSVRACMHACMHAYVCVCMHACKCMRAHTLCVYRL